MSSASPAEKPLYSYVVATSRLAHRQSQYDTSSSSPSSADSDNETVAQKLGIADIDHLETERFQIDRRKLEKMLQTRSEIEGVNSAEHFFEKIMKTTETFITWPRNLKLNARSRKDPFVRIVGRSIDNAWAKGLILANLAPRGPLLKMKMAIANTDHPHIIGRAGSNINRIMEDTGTHVHFPDSNRRNLVDKSNQVSLYGSLEGLERARSLLRLSTPLLMSFELIVSRSMPRHDSQFIKKLETNFNVKVIFFSTPRPSTYLVLVKGSEMDADNLKEAVQVLLNALCGLMASQTLVTIQLDISQQLYNIVTGQSDHNVQEVMDSTETSISFPKEMNLNSQICITGPINGVYAAKQELIGFLPLELIFDIGDEQTRTAEIMSLGSKYGISITMQQKHRDNSMILTISAPEKDVKLIYKAHREIIDMQTAAIIEPELPKAYYLQEPTYRRVLESNISNEPSQYEGIWAPTDPNEGSNFLHVTPSTAPITAALLNAADDNGMPPEVQSNSPHEVEEQRAVISSDSANSSDAANREGRLSSDWVLMKTAEGALSGDESQHYECDFDADDLEVAFIFMSSPTNASPYFMTAPGAERLPA